jgi:hypothetical protein
MEGDYTFDLPRILLGRLPWLYLVEILLRTTIDTSLPCSWSAPSASAAWASSPPSTS